VGVGLVFVLLVRVGFTMVVFLVLVGQTGVMKEGVGVAQ